MENLENDKITTQNQGRFDDVFGILTATTGASVEEMNEAIIESACEFNKDLED
ncbi:hypothetical protein LP123_01895 [Moraxella bovis]|uniref:Uncharacterized protein n=1 Tax=Moraxella bovis TaxID=476 RepID=A0AAQ2Q4Z2_MORBO|nr:hypothetical protein [Moraxella bovis]UYZ68789.1 hypothetical protein LP122_01345 [Moraxella bovis]UYZ71166.1 hypothetical protein LP089_01385 [Moraxella bovis]UYZ72917.1 hypothetical protein LP105_11245 [Moraxella bovis]UYZ75424.1 hypothetical protein LP093_11930 [Moraxella bovis]UYZ78633.1 hypothetical protein LP115_01870 [Moraxella bovis]